MLRPRHSPNSDRLLPPLEHRIQTPDKAHRLTTKATALAQRTSPDATRAGECPDYLAHQIITYIGSKRALLPFIEHGLRTAKRLLGVDRLGFLDLFSGTGVVSRMAKRHARRIIANDLETYSRITNSCYLSNRSEIDHDALQACLSRLEAHIHDNPTPGFITARYAPTDEHKIRPTDRVFYTRENAIYIDSARQAIARVPSRYQALLLGPLLAQASAHTNTAGVFKGFYKNRDGIGQFGGEHRNALKRIRGKIRLQLPVLSRFDCAYEIHQRDANALVRELEAVDVAYFDPPYNQHPYGSNYFMLNLICDYEPPQHYSRVSGIPVQWNRSRYNQPGNAADALFSAVDDCRCRFALISYNSEGFIPHEQFLSELRRCGRLTVMDTRYNTFRGCRNLRQRNTHVTEFLYLVDKRGGHAGRQDPA